MNTNFPDSDLSRHLAHKADEFDRRGGSPLDISQVLDRAGEIKRGRRMRATMVMAAAVLAVAVPTTLIATKGHTDKPVTPAHHAKIDTSPLSLDGLKRGKSPVVGYVDVRDNRFNVANGSTGLSVGTGTITAVAPISGGVVVAVRSSEGETAATFVNDQGGTIPGQGWPMDGSRFAVSEDGKSAAFVAPDGTPVVIFDEGRTFQPLPQIPAGSGFEPVAVTGAECADSGANTCEVLVTSHGKKPQTWVSTSTGHVGEYEQMSNVVDAFEGKLVAGFTEITDSGSCSVVESLEDLEQGSAWTTCDHSFGDFSPDGKHLSAYPAYRDGPGSSEFAVLDANTGTVVLDLHTTQDAFVQTAVWEDAEHLLAVVGEGRQAAILRIGLDGSREYAVPPTATEPYETPFVLPSR
jgi:hypothetical protein